MSVLEDLPRFDPITGDQIDPMNADHLICALERIKERLTRLGAARAQMEAAIALLAQCNDKTERVAGAERVAKVEWPGKTFDKPKLKPLWGAYPKFRETYLRIESVGVNMREYDKLIRTSGPEDLEQFKRELILLERDGLGKPTISIER